MLNPPIVSAKIDAPSQVANHSAGVSRVSAAAAATSATAPMATPPHPGTAVKAVARSMVWRMNDRLSIARAWSAGASDGLGGTSRGEAMGTVYGRSPILASTLRCKVQHLASEPLDPALPLVGLVGYLSSEVHWGQRVAPTGIAMRQ